MKTIGLGKTTLESSRLAYGCWRIAGDPSLALSTAERVTMGRHAVLAAYEAGYRLFDHADIYAGGMGESIFGEVLGEVPSMRDQILIASKCGIRKPDDPVPGAPYRYDFRREHIIESCERSLKRLRVERIDIYQLHRPDYLADPDEVAEAFNLLREAGKVLEFGLSNCRPTLLALLQKALGRSLVVHQVEISLLKRETFTDGTLDQCLMEKITPLAWSPLGGGRLVAGSREAPTQGSAALPEVLGQMAKARGVTPAVLGLAWLLKHPSGIIPIVGSTDPQRIREAAGAEEISLSHEEWYTLLEAARDERLP